MKFYNTANIYQTLLRPPHGRKECKLFQTIKTEISVEDANELLKNESLGFSGVKNTIEFELTESDVIEMLNFDWKRFLDPIVKYVISRVTITDDIFRAVLHRFRSPYCDRLWEEMAPNPTLTESMMMKLLTLNSHFNPTAENPNLTENMFDYMLNNDHRFENFFLICRNTHLTEEMITKIIEIPYIKLTGGLLEQLCEYQTFTDSQMFKLMELEYPVTFALSHILAKNPSLSYPVYEILKYNTDRNESPGEHVKLYNNICENPALKESILLEAIEYKVYYYDAKLLFSNKSFTDFAFSKLMYYHDCGCYYREELYNNPSITDEMISLMKDKKYEWKKDYTGRLKDRRVGNNG